MAEAASDVTTSCPWIPSQCVISWCLAFILSCEAHVGQRRSFIASAMVLAPGELSSSQMAGRGFLLVGWRKDPIFTPGPDSEGHLICLLINCNKHRCKWGARWDHGAWWRTFLTFNSLRSTHGISGNFCTIFGLQMVIPKTFLLLCRFVAAEMWWSLNIPYSATIRPKSGMAVMSKALMYNIRSNVFIIPSCDVSVTFLSGKALREYRPAPSNSFQTIKLLLWQLKCKKFWIKDHRLQGERAVWHSLYC